MNDTWPMWLYLLNITVVIATVIIRLLIVIN